MLPVLFKKIRLWRWKRKYRPGRIVSEFLAPDVRRDVQVVDASLIEAGKISAKIRTWNVLYAKKGIVPKPPFGDVVEMAIKDLWIWSGEPWGGPVPDSNPAPTDAEANDAEN